MKGSSGSKKATSQRMDLTRGPPEDRGEKKKKVEINNSCTRAGKARACVEYSHTIEIAKKSIKADKREYMNMLATETEQAARQGNLRQLYTIIKKLSGTFGKPERPVKDKGGKPVPDEEGQKRRWMEHFE